MKLFIHYFEYDRNGYICERTDNRWRCMMKKMLCLMCIGLFLFAAEFGRITGRVIDAETGEPLVGADVIVEGTELGAATDANGEYTVLFVPVGTHRVVTSYISYDPFTYTNVVVNADQTTPLSFRLQPTVIEVGEVVVEAERPMVVHCSSGNRVAGLWAVWLAERRGVEPARALELGALAGSRTSRTSADSV